jgi:exopolysaccharide biosynthesis polyprenyl glycosylphosphotransferase
VAEFAGTGNGQFAEELRPDASTTAGVLRLRRVMTERAHGHGRLADAVAAGRRAVWSLSNSNDLTIELDRTDGGFFGPTTYVSFDRSLIDQDAIGQEATDQEATDQEATDQSEAVDDAAELPAAAMDPTPTVVLRSTLGPVATLDAILATIDTPATSPSSAETISDVSADAVADRLASVVPPGPDATTGEVRRNAAARSSAVEPAERSHRARLGRHAAGSRVRASWEIGYVVGLLIADLAAGLVGGAVAFAARFGQVNPQNRAYVLISAALPGLFLLTLLLSRAYERRFLFVGSDEYQRVLRAGVFMTALTATLSYAFAANLARGYVVLALPVATLVCLGSRFALRQRLHRRRARGQCLRRVIVVGHELAVVAIARQLGRELYHGLEVVGCCLPPAHDGDVGMPIYGTFDDVAAAVRIAAADTVLVLSCPELDGRTLRRLAWRLERDDIDLIVASSLVDAAGSRATVRPVDGLPMLHVEHPRLSGAGRLVKSIFDRVSATIGLVMLAPLFAAAALAIRIDSRGPVLFRQVRIGKAGRRFVMYKFRTMVTDAEGRKSELADRNQGDGVLFKLREDPRVTGVGRWLRRFSIDELPQLINVIRGEMSLVGPRPPLPDEVAAYPSDMRRRLAVSPGLTGLWQVSGRSDLSWEETVRLDLRYVENWSFSLDLVILLRTLSAVCRSSGAY